MSDKKDKRERFVELLGLDSKNFLGSGLTFDEFWQLHRAEQIAGSWAFQSRDEKKRRLRAVLQLGAELDRIRQITEFSTRWAETAIEAIIEGDWKEVEVHVGYLAFDDEDDQLRMKYAPIFATFRELLLQVLRTDKEQPA